MSESKGTAPYAFSNDWFTEYFTDTRALVILRGLNTAAGLEIAERAWEFGIRAVEIPVQRPADLDTLREVAAAGRRRGRAVGAGTVVDSEQVDLVRRAGAAYTVSPGTDTDVIRASLDAGLPTLPGVATPSGIHRCVRLGLTWLKAFPAAVLGPGWFTAMRGPFPDVQFVAAGGVTADHAQALLGVGVRVLAFGSALADPAALRAVAALDSASSPTE